MTSTQIVLAAITIHQLSRVKWLLNTGQLTQFLPLKGFSTITVRPHGSVALKLAGGRVGRATNNQSH